MIIKDDKEILYSYLEDNSGIINGAAERAYLPETAGECAGLIRDLYEGSVPMTFSGSGTGMTGGRIPMEGVIVSNERLKKIELKATKKEAFVLADAGCTLEEIKFFCQPKGYFFPVNPTEETASVGAAASNNSSGSWTFKYGSVRDNIISIDFVTRDGLSLQLDKKSPAFRGDSILVPKVSPSAFARPRYEIPAVKNAAGYYSKINMPLIDLVIGAEGTLGYITKAALRVLRLPEKVFECILFFTDEKSSLDFVEKIKEEKKKNELIQPRALEFFNADALNLLREKHPQVPAGAVAAVIFEQEIFDISNENAIMDGFSSITESSGGLMEDIWMADNAVRLEELRQFRHSLPSVVNERFKRKEFFKLSTDTAVPDGCIREMIRFYNEEIRKAGITSLIFGHIGNNHLHVNLLANSDELEKARALYQKFMEKAVSLGGTISAEHGIGKLKKKYLPLLYGTQGIEEMKRIKNIFDPKNLFNRGNMFDIEEVN
jgi:D-lactate dehydrogenase (cytochrome)